MKDSFKKLLLISAIGVMGLTACGQTIIPSSSNNPSSETSSNVQSSNSSSQNSSSEEENKSVKITFWHTFGQTVVDGINSQIAKFKKLVKDNDDVDVEVELAYQGSYDDMENKVTKGISVGNIPSIAVAYPDHVADYLDIGKSSNENYVVNLDKYINDSKVGFGKEKWLGDEADADDIVPDFFEEGQCYSVEGTYSLPYMKSTEVMFYNRDQLVEAMKIFKPEFNSSQTKIDEYMSTITWDDFMDLCTCIKENKDDIGNMIEVPMYYDSDSNFFITKMYQNNIPYASINDGRGVIDFADGENRSKAVAMLGEIKDAYDQGLFKTKGIVNKYGSDYFTNEKCTFSIGSSGGAGYNFPQADSFDFGICRVPASNDNPLYITQGPTLCLFNNPGLSAEENELRTLYSYKFVKYLTNGEVNAQLCVNGSEGYMPVRYSAYETSFFQDFMAEEDNKYAEVADVVLNGINSDGGYIPTIAFKGSSALRDACGTALTAILNAESKNNISSILDDAISQARLKM